MYVKGKCWALVKFVLYSVPFLLKGIRTLDDARFNSIDMLESKVLQRELWISI